MSGCTYDRHIRFKTWNFRTRGSVQNKYTCILCVIPPINGVVRSIVVMYNKACSVSSFSYGPRLNMYAINDAKSLCQTNILYNSKTKIIKQSKPDWNWHFRQYSGFSKPHYQDDFCTYVAINWCIGILKQVFAQSLFNKIHMNDQE